MTTAGLSLQCEGENICIFTPGNSKELMQGQKVCGLYKLDVYFDGTKKAQAVPRNNHQNSRPNQARMAINVDARRNQNRMQSHIQDKIRDTGNPKSRRNFITEPLQLEGESRIVELSTDQEDHTATCTQGHSLSKETMHVQPLSYAIARLGNISGD